MPSARAERDGARRRGNTLGFAIFAFSARIFGLGGAYGLLYIVCLYYLLFDRAARRSCMPYLRRRFPRMGAIGRWIAAYRIFIGQGRSLIDRHAMLSGAVNFDIAIKGYDKILSLLAHEGRGIVFLTAHVGNWQATMGAFTRFGMPVNLMMRSEDNEAVRRAMGVGEGEEGPMRVILTDGFLGGVIESLKALRNGEAVCLMGDRSYGSESAPVGFLGDTAHLPVGAFLLAASAGCPVVFLLPAKTGRKSYEVDVSRFVAPPERQTRAAEKSVWAAQGAAEFARALEQYTERQPYQWYVFHDIWKKD